MTKEKITRGLRAISPPKCKKEPLKIAIDGNVKILFNVADLIVNGLWKVAPEKKEKKIGLIKTRQKSLEIGNSNLNEE